MSASLVPSPVRMARARSLILATSSSAMGPTATAALMAVQRSPRGSEAGVDHGVGGQVEVGIRRDHSVVLGAAEGLDTLVVGGAGGVDVLRDRGGADEGYRLHLPG